MATRISDLPDISSTKSERGLGGGEFSGQNTYMPINNHPNPYMSQQNQHMQPPPMQPSQRMQQTNVGISYDQQEMLANMPAHRLPSRDIPIDQTGYTQDEQIVPNYIPPMSDLGDFVKDHELITEEIKVAQSKKTRGQIIDGIINEIQTPLCIALLYYVFQLPIVNNLLFKYITFLKLYKEDGNLNMNGMILKSLFFGILYYGMVQLYSFIASDI